jgi:hypothetical protein
MVCELLTCSKLAILVGPFDCFPAMARPHTQRVRFSDQLPACEMVLDIIGNLFTHGRQLKHLVFDDRIVSLLGKLPILDCFLPEIVSPVHVTQSNEPGS